MPLVAGIPNLFQAFFSILEPGKSIPAHEGPYCGYLRYHLGLIVPEESPPDDQKYGCAAVLAATTMTMAAVTRISRRRSTMAHRGGMVSSRQADDAARTFRAVVITHPPRAVRVLPG